MTTTDDGTAPSHPGVVLAESSPGGRARLSTRRKDRSHPHSVATGRRRWPWVVAIVVVLLIAATTWFIVQRINAPLAPAEPGQPTTAALVVPGAGPALPWPAKGQGAVVVPSIGFSAQSGPESPVPVASLTKMTTAVVILRDHPLAPGAQGPAIPVTSADVDEYQAELHLDESSITIQTGETLTERQMLEALLLVSANDMAYSLATWDAGSIPAFVQKMNGLATTLGMTNTHYVDASGYDPQSVSSAADVLKVGSVGMAIPSFAEIVALDQATVPLVGTVHNIVSEVGANGVVGIKSGYTSQAGACLVLAANRVIGGRSLLVIEAVLGQPTPPPTVPTTTTTTTSPGSPTTTTTTTTKPAGPTTTTTTVPLNDLPIADPFKYARPVAEGLLSAAQAGVTQVTVAKAGAPVGSVTATWGGTTHSATYATSTGAWLPGWPGQAVQSKTVFTRILPGSPTGTRIGSVVFGIGAQFEAVPLTLSETVPEPSVWWRLRHGEVTETTSLPT